MQDIVKKEHIYGIEVEEKDVSEKIKVSKVKITNENGEQQIFLNKENVTGLIRTEEVGNMASQVSVYPAVREKLLELQRNLARTADVIMDGRDIGTCVLPEAPLKIYLTAAVETRGKRRYDELCQKGNSCDFEEICRDIKERDERDMNREIAPLKQAVDAVLLDSSNMTIEEVVKTIEEYAKERGFH